LTTHFIDEVNENIATGQWRPINLVAPPFNLAEPLDALIEETKMFDQRFAKSKVMALWKVADLPDFN
ncbi:MAG: class I SAM-dependent methyltransferase, partial [Pseudomonadota bacterium]